MPKSSLNTDDLDLSFGFSTDKAQQFEPSDDPFFTVVGDHIRATYIPNAVNIDGQQYFPANGGTPVPAGTPGSTIAVVAASGFTINLLFDTAAMAAPASFRAGIQQAASILAANIADHITVDITIDYFGTGGGAAAGPDNGQFVSYSTVRNYLINNASPGDTVFNSLPAGSSIQGQSNVAVWNAQLRLMGLLSANDTTIDDGSATFATDINPNLLVGVALHELTHAMGRVPYGPQPDIFDLFRFTSPSTRLFSGGATAPAAYFSLDGGATKIADYGRTSDASDFLNSGVQGSTDPFNEFYNGATAQHLSAVDLQQLDVLGFHLVQNTPDTQAPTLVADNPLSLRAGATQTITAALLSFTDNVSSGAQLRYTVTTAATNGTLLLNGAATSTFTQADIANGLVTYHETAPSATTDSFQFTVADTANNATAVNSFQISITPDHAPVVTIPNANVTASAGQVFQASSLFTASDADNDVLTYYLYDSSAGANTGHWVVNGSVIAAQTVIALGAGQLAQTTFVAGAAGSADDLAVMAYDGQAYSGNTSFSPFRVSVAGVNHAPAVTIPSSNVAASAGQVFQASSLFTANDADNDVLTYYLYDSSAGANTGHWVVNGSVVAAQTVIALGAGQLAQTTFVAGAAGSTDDLAVMVYDGQAYSGNTSFSPFHVSVAGANHAPVVTIPSANVSASAGQVFRASSLFSVTDADNDVLTYYLYDASTAANSGHWVVNGSVMAAGTVVALGAGQLAQTTFVAGAAGTTDDLSVMAYDGHTYSGNTSFSTFHVNVPASGTAPLAASSAASGQGGADFFPEPADNFVFADKPEIQGLSEKHASPSTSFPSTQVDFAIAHETLQFALQSLSPENPFVFHPDPGSSHLASIMHDLFLA